MATGEIERAAGASTFSRWYGIRLTVQPRRYKTRRRLVIACVALVLLIWVATWVHSGTMTIHKSNSQLTHTNSQTRPEGAGGRARATACVAALGRGAAKAEPRACAAGYRSKAPPHSLRSSPGPAGREPRWERRGYDDVFGGAVRSTLRAGGASGKDTQKIRNPRLTSYQTSSRRSSGSFLPVLRCQQPRRRACCLPRAASSRPYSASFVRLARRVDSPLHP
jgi:hypothetical protein